ncbi:hypothetical protein ONE63_004088 [Megalurothrips usitatus]|uniref:Uncharacterized protein n=1 Tax=Megalurothrips usitatus TaxID=439358 RepID=A0AAV7X598_9NEOP|nr:hypothetical protein ONE63_004088 [Megalurothrips usitatus]
MAIHLNCSKKVVESLADGQPEIHFMPCSIKCDGPANVSKFFKPTANDKDPNYMKASFRGRPLNGEELTLPSGYKGVIVQETKRPLVENVERTLHASSMFDKIVYWNWDKLPSANDSFISALSWIDISEALHAPVENSDN